MLLFIDFDLFQTGFCIQPHMLIQICVIYREALNCGPLPICSHLISFVVNFLYANASCLLSCWPYRRSLSLIKSDLRMEYLCMLTFLKIFQLLSNKKDKIPYLPITFKKILVSFFHQKTIPNPLILSYSSIHFKVVKNKNILEFDNDPNIRISFTQ